MPTSPSDEKYEQHIFQSLNLSSATRLARAGVDFYKIGKLLGHKDIRMTQRYSHHYPESFRESVEVSDNYFTITIQSQRKRGCWTMKKSANPLILFGGGYRDRTGGLLIANQPLSHLS